MTGGRGPGARRSRPRRPSPSIARASSVRPSPSFYRLSPLTRRPRCPCPARRTWPDPVTAPHLFERDSCRGFPQPPRAFHHRDERGVGAHREVLEVRASASPPRSPQLSQMQTHPAHGPGALPRSAHAGRLRPEVPNVYGVCMARLISTTVRLEEQDVRALQRARAAGHSASALIRKGLRVVASRYYTGRRPPSTRLFESTDNKLGDESELFRDLDA